MAWISLLIFSLAAVLVTVLQLDHLETSADGSSLVEISADRGVRLRFQNYFVIFGALYYTIGWLKGRRFKSIFKALPFILYLVVVVQGRVLIVALFLTVAVFGAFSVSPRRLFVSALVASGVGVAVLVVINLVMPDFVSKIGTLFEQALIVARGRMSDDESANARLIASVIVIGYWERDVVSLIFGTGALSNQFLQGYAYLFGYFHPSDIGILGGIFVYGLVGSVFLMLVPAYFSIMVTYRTAGSDSLFVDSLRCLLIFALLRAPQGPFYFAGIEYAIPLFVLMAVRELSVSNAGMPGWSVRSASSPSVPAIRVRDSHRVIAASTKQSDLT